jgi:hypothetical protein
MVDFGSAEFKDCQVYKSDTEDSVFRAIPSWFKWSLRWLTGGIQKMVSNCWYKSAGNSSGYPKILNIIQIGIIERQKENTSNYTCAVILSIPGVGLNKISRRSSEKRDERRLKIVVSYFFDGI